MPRQPGPDDATTATAGPVASARSRVRKAKSEKGAVTGTKTAKRKTRGTQRKRTKVTAVTTARGRGRPPKVPTKDQIMHVQTMAMYGATKEHMAAMLDISLPTFNKYLPEYFGPAIARGRASGFMVSSRALFKGMSEGNMTSVIWYEKTRHGMTEKLHTVHSDPDGQPLPGAPAHVSVGIFLPPNGRDVPAEGREIPAQFHVVATQPSAPAGAPAPRPAMVLPANGREQVA